MFVAYFSYGSPATRYQLWAGRRIYAGHVAELYCADIEAEHVAVTAGCNQAFYVAMIALAKVPMPLTTL